MRDYKDDKIHAVVDSREYTYELSDVNKVVVLTTDLGPFYADMGLAIDVGNNTAIALLKQANTDSVKMAEVIGVSEAQLRFVTNTSSGKGLLKCGSVVIPFDNQVSKDTDLYKLYNTNIHEKIAEIKAKEKDS